MDPQEQVKEFHKKQRVCTASIWPTKSVEEYTKSSGILMRIAANMLACVEAEQPQANKFLAEQQDARLFRALLIVEEVAEILEALSRGDIYGVADGVGDTLFVTYGLCDVFNLPGTALFNAICKSNMTKAPRSPNDPRLRDKGADYKKPDIAKVLNAFWYPQYEPLCEATQGSRSLGACNEQ